MQVMELVENKHPTDTAESYDEIYKQAKDDALEYKNVPIEKNAKAVNISHALLKGTTRSKIDAFIYRTRSCFHKVIKELKEECSYSPTWATMCDFHSARARLDNFKENVKTAYKKQIRQTHLHKKRRFSYHRRKLIKQLEILEKKYKQNPTWEIKDEIEYVKQSIDYLYEENTIKSKNPYKLIRQLRTDRCRCVKCMQKRYQRNLVAKRSHLREKIESIQEEHATSPSLLNSAKLQFARTQMIELYEESKQMHVSEYISKKNRESPQAVFARTQLERQITELTAKQEKNPSPEIESILYGLHIRLDSMQYNVTPVKDERIRKMHRTNNVRVWLKNEIEKLTAVQFTDANPEIKSRIDELQRRLFVLPYTRKFVQTKKRKAVRIREAQRAKYATEIATLLKMQTETPNPKIQNALQMARLKLRSVPYLAAKLSVEEIANDKRNTKTRRYILVKIRRKSAAVMKNPTAENKLKLYDLHVFYDSVPLSRNYFLKKRTCLVPKEKIPQYMQWINDANAEKECIKAKQISKMLPDPKLYVLPIARSKSEIDNRDLLTFVQTISRINSLPVLEYFPAIYTAKRSEEYKQNKLKRNYLKRRIYTWTAISLKDSKPENLGILYKLHMQLDAVPYPPGLADRKKTCLIPSEMITGSHAWMMPKDMKNIPYVRKNIQSEREKILKKRIRIRFKITEELRKLTILQKTKSSLEGKRRMAELQEQLEKIPYELKRPTSEQKKQSKKDRQRRNKLKNDINRLYPLVLKNPTAENKTMLYKLHEEIDSIPYRKCFEFRRQMCLIRKDQIEYTGDDA